jgi:tRNA(fMet)-specific endonuclease VapC
MVVLETDHLSLLERRESAGSRILQGRLDRLETGACATTIVTYEEQTRGWMAYTARAKTVDLSDFRKVPGLKVADWTLAGES